jgi:hypothetical protein
MKKKIVFIMSAGHSGSSLLALILGSHSRCFSVGELKGLANRYRKGLYIDCVNRNSRYWEKTFGDKGLKDLAISLSEARVHGFVPLKLEKWLRSIFNHKDPIVNPYTFMFSKMDCDVIVDSSKSRSWIEKRLQAREFSQDNIDPYLIHLVRDGRAVVNSWLRKYPERDIVFQSEHWSKRHQERLDFYKAFPDSRKIEIRYESLASSPYDTAKKICDFIDIEFESEMIEYWKFKHYDISGNNGTYSLIDKYKGLSLSDQDDYPGKDYFESLGLCIKLDLRWKNEFSREKLETFNRISGNLNRPYEWD